MKNKAILPLSILTILLYSSCATTHLGNEVTPVINTITPFPQNIDELDIDLTGTVWESTSGPNKWTFYFKTRNKFIPKLEGHYAGTFKGSWKTNGEDFQVDFSYKSTDRKYYTKEFWDPWSSVGNNVKTFRYKGKVKSKQNIIEIALLTIDSKNYSINNYSGKLRCEELSLSKSSKKYEQTKYFFSNEFEKELSFRKEAEI